MPDSNLTSAPARALTPDARPLWRRWLAEPLVHFLALGGLIFALTAALAPAEDRSRVIELSAEMRSQIAGQYRSTHGRDPTAAELAPLIENWVRTQILYREALTLGLDRGDDMIRERITHKMNLLVFSRVATPQPTEAGLRTWFEANRARYDQPVRYDFFGLVLDPPATQEQAERIARELDDEDTEPPAELVARVRPYANRDRAGIAALFGPDGAEALAALPLDTWRALPTVQNGQPAWLVARVARVQPARPPEFDAVRPQVEDAWRIETTRKLANDAVDRLGAGYIIRSPPP